MATTHGGGVAGTPRAPVAVVGATGALVMRGYRNFLGKPGLGETFRHGADDAETHRLMGVLASLMQTFDEEVEKFENPNLPSGYTYLLQLVAHDCVRTPTPFWALPPARREARNARIARLRLDTVYGEGPAACPFAYAPDDAGDIVRTRLRLGPTKALPTLRASKPLYRDIARAAVPSQEAEDPRPRKSPPHKPMLGDPLIVDPRNEDNAFVAQVTTLFHLLHNALIRKLGGPPYKNASEATDELPRAEARFACARAATTMIYREILREDVLPRLLHGSVLDVYRNARPEDLLDRDPDFPQARVPVPLEFSHGAFRFAHSMIRPSYRTNDGAEDQTLGAALLNTSARGPAEMPLNAKWILSWGHFFELGGKKPANLSLRIGPRYTQDLMDEDLFPAPPGGDQPGVAFQDLASASLARLWSVEALYAKLRTTLKAKGWRDLFEGTKLATPEARAKALRAWMRKKRPMSRPSDEDVEALVADPPLPFYIQFEAEHEHGGKRLGPLGSILVAEVLYGAMLDDPMLHEQPGQALKENLSALAQALGHGTELDDVPEIRGMGDLVQFIAAEHRLGTARPSFL